MISRTSFTTRATCSVACLLYVLITGVAQAEDKSLHRFSLLDHSVDLTGETLDGFEVRAETQTLAPGLAVATLTLTRDAAAPPPELQLKWAFPPMISLAFGRRAPRQPGLARTGTRPASAPCLRATHRCSSCLVGAI